MKEFAEALGVRVIEVDELGHKGVYVQAARVLLVDSALDDEARAYTLQRAVESVEL